MGNIPSIPGLPGPDGPIAKPPPAQPCPPEIVQIYDQYKNAPLQASIDENEVFVATCGGQTISIPSPSKLLYYIIFVVVGALLGYFGAQYMAKPAVYAPQMGLQPTPMSPVR